jgi:hypothetical protein
MKRLLLTLFIVLVSLSLQSQYISLGFETPPPYILSNSHLKMDVVFYNDSGNIWQVGKPKKHFFDTAAEGQQAAVTDTANTYPINNYSYFDVVMYDMYALSIALTCNFSFTHKYQTTKGKDGGYILVSTDSRVTWKQLIDSTNKLSSWCEICNASKETYNFYKHIDTLENGQPAFSGTSNGWITSNMHFGSLIVKKQPFDTLIFRFVFQSDSIPEANDGWIIDEINFSGTASWKAKERHLNSVTLYPNPAKSQLSISSVDGIEIQSITLKDLLGKTMLSKTFDCNFEEGINIETLPKGNYLAEIVTDKGVSVQKVMVK